MIKSLTNKNEYISFIEEYILKYGFDIPYCENKEYILNKSNNALIYDDEIILGSYQDNKLCGLFILSTLNDEKYIEALLILSKQEKAYEELFSYLKETYNGWNIDFVFNPENQLLKNKLEELNGDFDIPQYEMILTDLFIDIDYKDIKLLERQYEESYILMHNNDLYWTAEKILETKDKFKIYIAINNEKVIGYIDLKLGKDEIFINDLLIQEEYRSKGYGKKLISKAFYDNDNKKISLTVNIDNINAISLYKSLGFKKKENSDSQVCHLKIY